MPDSSPPYEPVTGESPVTEMTTGQEAAMTTPQDHTPCDGGFRCPATTHIEGCFTGEGHPDARSAVSAVPVRCSRCQVLMTRQGENYVCPDCGRTMSVQRCEEVAGRRGRG